MNKTLTDDMIVALKQAALAATPQNIDSAQSIDHYNDGRYIECPCCSGEGSVELEADFLNYDGKALGVQFYGIGAEPGAAEAYFRAASPANTLALLDRLERAEAAPLAAHPGQPEPRAEAMETVRVPARVLDLLNIINRDGVLKRAAELQEVYRLTGAVRVGEAS
ncbi:hypothetical protein [Burkholderia multivorans]|uniref:hypothetical protein n=1 Tax=Burkholderia multivorans TaxID=87883 RepID=UPI001C2620DD|nr:hypothetical protein [Burkholderia multivorans]MBU9592711.1 hypothetical protein [Burkholderia multivorans]